MEGPEALRTCSGPWDIPNIKVPKVVLVLALRQLGRPTTIDFTNCHCLIIGIPHNILRGEGVYTSCGLELVLGHIVIVVGTVTGLRTADVGIFGLRSNDVAHCKHIPGLEVLLDGRLCTIDVVDLDLISDELEWHRRLDINMSQFVDWVEGVGRGSRSLEFMTHWLRPLNVRVVKVVLRFVEFY